MLSCYRILDLTDDKGFFCGKVLGDLGADVIKIEKPGGDPCRSRGPFYHDIPDPEKSLYWFAFNANKKGITLDIGTSDGREIFKTLVERSDVVIESFMPGYMDKLGLGYPALSKVNPGIILTSISGFGQEGPYRDYNSGDIAVWALSGFMYIMGEPDRPPLAPGYPHGYLLGAVNGAIGTMAAISHRRLTGQGQWVDASTHQSLCMATSLEVKVPWAMARVITARTGRNRWRINAKDGTALLPAFWECKDGIVACALGLGPEQSSAALVEWIRSDGIDPGILGPWDWKREDWTGHTLREAEEVVETLRKFFKKHTKKELSDGATQRRIQMTPLLTPKDQLEYPQLVERDFWTEVPHPELDAKITYPGGFAKLTETACGIRFRAPLIGEHNDEIYRKELGMSTEQLVALKQRRVI